MPSLRLTRSRFDRPGRRAGVVLALTAVLAVLVAAVAPAAAPRHATARRCRLTVTTVARGQHAPDDLAIDGSRILVSDIKANTLGVVRGGHVATLMSGLGGPEGIIVRSPTRLELAAQSTNQILSVDLHRHTTSVLAQLPTVPGQSGLDSIEAAPGGDTWAPDSANGVVYRLHRGHLRAVAGGFVRPVDVRGWAGGIAVADEYGSWVYLQTGSRRIKLAKILLPDDLAVLDGHLLATGQTGQLWEVAPHRRLLTGRLKYPQGMVADGPGTVLVSEQSANRIVRVSGLTGCL
ncbi:MAG TPA: hypothetical protein VFN55_08150 [Solirubrobacteraceae bacterium]|nr:hypothetical protein [Solirubrobacteraceae bacterium]